MTEHSNTVTDNTSHSITYINSDSLDEILHINDVLCTHYRIGCFTSRDRRRRWGYTNILLVHLETFSYLRNVDEMLHCLRDNTCLQQLTDTIATITTLALHGKYVYSIDMKSLRDTIINLQELEKRFHL